MTDVFAAVSDAISRAIDDICGGGLGAAVESKPWPGQIERAIRMCREVAGKVQDDISAMSSPFVASVSFRPDGSTDLVLFWPDAPLYKRWRVDEFGSVSTVESP